MATFNRDDWLKWADTHFKAEPSDPKSSKSSSSKTLSRSRGWLITNHAWLKNNESVPRTPNVKAKGLRCIRCAHEVGEEYIENRTPENFLKNQHYQEAPYFDKPLTILQVKKRLYGDKSYPAHLEPARNFAKAWEYCSPDYLCDDKRYKGTRYYRMTKREAGHHISMILEHGEPPQQGRRMDLIELAQLIQEGKTKRQVYDVLNDLDYKITSQVFKAVDTYFNIYSPHRQKDNDPKDIFWFYGPTHSGKTTSARKHFDDLGISYYEYTACSDWNDFQLYEGQDAIILDDLRADNIPLSQLITFLTSKYATKNAKYGIRHIAATKIIITSPYHPSSTFNQESKEDIQQLLRRIGTIRYFPPLPDAPPPMPKFEIYTGSTVVPVDVSISKVSEGNVGSLLYSITSNDFCASPVDEKVKQLFLESLDIVLPTPDFSRCSKLPRVPPTHHLHPHSHSASTPVEELDEDLALGNSYAPPV